MLTIFHNCLPSSIEHSQHVLIPYPFDHGSCMPFDNVHLNFQLQRSVVFHLDYKPKSLPFYLSIVFLHDNYDSFFFPQYWSCLFLCPMVHSPSCCLLFSTSSSSSPVPAPLPGLAQLSLADELNSTLSQVFI